MNLTYENENNQLIRAFFLLDKNSFQRNSGTYGTPYHAIVHFVFWCHDATYRTPCHSSGHLVIYRECYVFERTFLYSQAIFTLHSLLLFPRLPWEPAVQPQSIVPTPYRRGSTICLNHCNPQQKYAGRFYLRVIAVYLMKNLLPTGFELLSRQVSMLQASCFIRSATERCRLTKINAPMSDVRTSLHTSYRIRTLSATVQDVKSRMFYLFGHRVSSVCVKLMLQSLS